MKLIKEMTRNKTRVVIACLCSVLVIILIFTYNSSLYDSNNSNSLFKDIQRQKDYSITHINEDISFKFHYEPDWAKLKKEASIHPNIVIYDQHDTTVNISKVEKQKNGRLVITVYMNKHLNKTSGEFLDNEWIKKNEIYSGNTSWSFYKNGKEVEVNSGSGLSGDYMQVFITPKYFNVLSQGNVVIKIKNVQLYKYEKKSL